MKSYISSARLLIIALLSSSLSQYASAQVTFSSWVHTPGITLYASAPAMYGVGTSANITADDGYSGWLNIGFNFNFYGASHNHCLIGSNGRLRFDSSMAGAYDPWPVDHTLAGDAEDYNSICGPACDLYVPAGGQVTYFTTGTAPNRVFVASYCHVAMYSCTTKSVTTQVMLYETSNIVEVHIGHKDSCSWNGGHAIVGVQNTTGTASTAAPGRDYPNIWETDHEAWKFTPDATLSSYSVASIPYAPIPYYTIYWFDSTTGTLLGTGDSIVIAVGAAGNYKAAAISCTDTGSTGVDTVAWGFLRLSSLSVDQPLSVNELSVYPNPANNVLYITNPEMMNAVTITNLLGQTVLEQKVADTRLQLDISHLPPAVYLLKVNGSIVRPFVKE